MVKETDTYEKVMELARRRGFVWPSAEIYGSVAGFVDYGPLGAMMKRRIENIWRKFYVVQEGYYEIESPTIGIEDIFIASGHVKGFADKMIQCPHCREYLRADHCVEDGGGCSTASLCADALQDLLQCRPCPSCGEILGPVPVFEFNLMFETGIGPGSQRKGYLRPETAQGMFTLFQRLLRFYRDRLPFGAVQIGKSYRNEISPRQGMIRLREFSQAEAEIFVHPQEKQHPAFWRYADYPVDLLGIREQQEGRPPIRMTMADAVREGCIANEYVAYYVALTHQLMVRIGVDTKRLRFRQHLCEERAHYATDCWDAEILSDRFGWVEIVGIADRTDYDLRAHAKQSGTPFTVFVPFKESRRERRRRVVPDMKKLGPLFRERAKEVGEALAAAEPVEEGAWIDVRGERVLIPPDCYQVREEDVEVRGEEVVPHVIEPSYGVDRMLYAVLEHSYGEDTVEGEVRRVLRLPPHVAPIQAAVFPLVNRDGLNKIAEEVACSLTTNGILAEYDDAGAIGRRYRRQDEVGTPYAVTIDYDTKEDRTVTLRERDSMEQVRVPLDTLPVLLNALLEGRQTFASLCP